jgi:hypothetical protein
MENNQNTRNTHIPSVTPPTTHMTCASTDTMSVDMKSISPPIQHLPTPATRVLISKSSVPVAISAATTPYWVPSITRSMFPPRPRNVPISSTAFATDVVVSLDVARVKTMGKSSTIALFSRVMNEHMKQTTTTTITSTTTSSAASANTISTYINEHIHDITRIRVIPPRDTKSHRFTFYVNTNTADACQALRHVIMSRTSLICRDITDQIVLGRVYPIPYLMSTEDVLSHVHATVPRITSLTITRISHSPPSTFVREHAYFSIRADELHLLGSLTPLPGYRTPLSWERLNSITNTQMTCSLCYSHEHTKSKCPHLTKGTRFCSNCAKPDHVAKQCKLPRQCVCCGEVGHSVFDCNDYKPSYHKLTFQLSSHDFPPLSPNSPSVSWGSASVSPAPSVASSNSSASSISSRSVKRARHTSFDNDDVVNHDSRDNRMVSPAMQHMQARSPTRRAVTPHPSSRSSSRSSISSSVSVREQQLEQQLQLQQQQQQIKLLQQQLEQLMQQMKQSHNNTQTPCTTTTSAANQQPTEPSHMQD